MLSHNGEKTFMALNCVYQSCNIIYKMNQLSDPVSVLANVIQNTVLCFTNTGHEK